MGWRRSCKRLGLSRSARARAPHLGRFLYKLMREDILELLETKRRKLSVARERERERERGQCHLHATSTRSGALIPDAITTRPYN